MSSIGAISGNSYLQSDYIASGKRINRAADDASGMTQAESLRSQETGQNAANQNIQQSIGAANVSDSALDSITDYLQRIKELAVKSINGLYSDDDKMAIQKEINQNIDGINQIAENTTFNTKNVLDGSVIQVASQRNGQGPNLSVSASAAENLGIAGFSVMGDDVDIDAIDNAIKTVSSMRSGVGASTNGLESALRYGQISAQQALESRSNVEDLDMAKAVSENKKKDLLDEYSLMMQKKKQEEDEGLTNALFSKM